MSITETKGQPGVLIGSNDMPYGTEIRLAQAAEELGFSEFWYTDNKFVRDCFAGLALVSEHTSRIKVGPGVCDPYSRHPAMIAMGVATIDEISGGRGQIGLSTGGTGLPAMKIPKTRQIRALREAIEIIRGLLSGEEVHYVGELFHCDGARLGFEPPQGADMPLFVASHAPQALSLAGQLADGVLLSHTSSRDGLEAAVATIRSGEAKADRALGTTRVRIRLEACISATDGPAYDKMRPAVAKRLAGSFPNWEREEGFEPTPEILQAAEARDVSALTGLLPDSAIRASCLVGSPESIREQLSQLFTADVDGLTIRPVLAEGQSMESSMALFMEEVWNKL